MEESTPATRKSTRLSALLLARAREMRRNPTPAEDRLWRCLRDRQLCGLKFRRQSSLSPYIRDFYCPSAQVVVELDGDSHDGEFARDHRRQQWLEDRNLRVIRFTNEEVYHSLDAVLEKIAVFCGADA